MKINAQYSLADPGSLAMKIAGDQRRRMYEKFLSLSAIAPQDSVLDLGVTSDRTYSHSNYFELWYPHKDRITACGLDDASFLEETYPGLKFVRADGRALPFANLQFDYVHSSAVLEHVGDRSQQLRFIAEAWRVARKGLFLTTPNRWFPVEFHTTMPLVHWLPPAAFQKICRMRGLDFFATIDHLNLLSAGQLKELAKDAALDHTRITSVSLGGWPSNLLLLAKRQDERILHAASKNLSTSVML
jgi:hypothetical protein